MISSETIQKAVFNLCVEANTVLSDKVFEAILNAYDNETNIDAKQTLQLILKNAKLSYETKKPLCQDTGQVLVFAKIGEKAQVEKLNQSINDGVEKAYAENFYRKSVVKDALFDRENTKTNTPCIIYTEIVEGDELELEVLIKGAGAENMSAVSMLSPTAGEEEIVEFVKAVVQKAGAKACPPFFIGVGIGGTIEYAGLLSKKALLCESFVDDLMLSGRNARPTLQADDVGKECPAYFANKRKVLAEKIKREINELKIGAAGFGGDFTALDVKVLTEFTHIASMPVAVTINCHSSRHSKCVIKDVTSKFKLINNLDVILNLFQNRISERPCDPEMNSGRCRLLKTRKEVEYFIPTLIKNYTPEQDDFSNFVKIDASNISAMRGLKQGQNVLLSGEIYTARDMAHKKLVEKIEKSEALPFDLKDKIIFYAGPCPCPQGQIIGSVGPTTSSRMDKFAPTLYKAGVLATIGKGDRSSDVLKAVKEFNGLYFTAIGGIACYLSQKIVKNEIIAFEELGAESIYRLIVSELPLRVDYR